LGEGRGSETNFLKLWCMSGKRNLKVIFLGRINHYILEAIFWKQKFTFYKPYSIRQNFSFLNILVFGMKNLLGKSRGEKHQGQKQE